MDIYSDQSDRRGLYKMEKCLLQIERSQKALVEDEE
jgi:hypothetical protein